MNKTLLIILIPLVLSCTNSNSKKTVIDFNKTETEEAAAKLNGSKAVYIAIASMTSPKETYIYYNDLIKYISNKVGHPIYIKQKKTYEEVNILLENAEVDFAFICSGAYVEDYEKEKLKLLVAPEINHNISYKAYLIAHKDLNINSFSDFKNKSFAFTDPLSCTGRLFPLKELEMIKKKENDFFKKTIYTNGHDISIQMVNRGIIDGASVHSIIYNYLALYHPERVENIKIIKESETFGMPPVVTPLSLDKKTFDIYQNIFTNIHNDSIGNSILEKLNIDKFIKVNDSIYHSVLELKELICNATTK